MPVTKAMTGRLSIGESLIQEVAQNKIVGPLTTRTSPKPVLNMGRLIVLSAKAARAKSRIRLIQWMYSIIVLATQELSDHRRERSLRTDASVDLSVEPYKAEHREGDAVMTDVLSPFYIHGFSPGQLRGRYFHSAAGNFYRGVGGYLE